MKVPTWESGQFSRKRMAEGQRSMAALEGGPGEQAGLKTGDVIKAVDGTDVTEKKLPTSLPWSVTVIKIS